MGNLPVGGTRLVGRAQELSAARAVLRRGRLLTLTGGPGVGKTRLALQIGATVENAFPDGVWFVELSSVHDGERVAEVIAETLGVGETTLGVQARPARCLLDALVDHLARSRTLLILDNCEHLLDTTAQLAHTLLRTSPALRIIVTSRQTLRADGEQVLAVPPLPVPDPDDAHPPGAVARFDGVRLFAERAAAASRGFRVTADNHTAVARICHRLEGNPLAIELAAVRARAMPVERILQRLDGHIGLLTEGSSVGIPRLRSPRSAIGWSYGLCSARQRALWQRLTVFRGGFGLDDAEEVCAGHGIDRQEVWRLLDDLIDMSIAVRETQETLVRFRLPEMIREFGAEALLRSAHREWVRRRHGDHYLAMAVRAEAEPMEQYGTRQVARMRVDRDNLHAAAEFWAGVPGEATAALRITTVLARHYLVTGLVSKGRQLLERALDLETGPCAVRARALWTTGWLALLQGQTADALILFRRCRVLARTIGDASALRRVVQFTGLAAIFQGRYRRARLLLRQALAEHRAAGDDDGRWLTLFQLSMAGGHLGDHRQAIASGERSLAVCRAYDASWAEAHALWVTGIAHLWCGETGPAGRLLREALAVKHALRDRWGVAHCVEALAWTLAESRPEDAARLLGGADRLWRSIGSPPAQYQILADTRRSCRERLGAALGRDRFTRAFRAGTRLSTDRTVALALGAADVTLGPARPGSRRSPERGRPAPRTGLG